MVRSSVMLATMAVLGAGPSLAQAGPPLPPPRPQNASPPAASPAPPAETPQDIPKETGPALPGADADLCLSRLKAAGFEVDAAEQPSSPDKRCQIETPVRLKAVTVPSRPGTMIRLGDQPILACRFADAFGRWVGDLVAPMLPGALKSELKSVRTGPGFACRNRNGAATGKLSAHAEGLAIDIVGFELANGETLRVKPEADAPPHPALTALRTGACGWFTTVLGPGSDAAHGDHLHVDVQQHGSSDRYRICQ